MGTAGVGRNRANGAMIGGMVHRPCHGARAWIQCVDGARLGGIDDDAVPCECGQDAVGGGGWRVDAVGGDDACVTIRCPTRPDVDWGGVLRCVGGHIEGVVHVLDNTQTTTSTLNKHNKNHPQDTTTIHTCMCTPLATHVRCHWMMQTPWTDHQDMQRVQ